MVENSYCAIMNCVLGAAWRLLNSMGGLLHYRGEISYVITVIVLLSPFDRAQKPTGSIGIWRGTKISDNVEKCLAAPPQNCRRPGEPQTSAVEFLSSEVFGSPKEPE